MILDWILGKLNSTRAKRGKLWVALILVPASLILWLVTSLTVARDEPQFTLGLSWIAVTLLALDLLTTAQVHEGNGDSDGD